MKKGCLIAAGVGGALLVIILIALLVTDRKYEFLWAAPRVTHNTLLPADTCAQLVIRPDVATADIPKLFPRSKVPPSLLNRVLPYEIAMWCTGAPGADHMGVTVFVNDRRFGPMIRQGANASTFRGVFPNVSWAADLMNRERRGKLELSGELPVSQATRDTVETNWSSITSYNSLDIDGKHLIELALDNRSGGAYELIASLPRPNSPESLFYQDKNNVKLFAGISLARLTADLAPGNTATIELEIQTNPQANMIFAVKLLLDASIPPINETLKRNYGASLEGKSTTEKDTIRGRYVLSNVDRLFSAAGGSGGR